MTDASNHKDEKKIFPILRYFDATHGVQMKLWKLKSLPGESSDLISSFLNGSLESIGAKEKTVALYADNTNCNFGEVNRKGKNNVFTKLKNYLGHELLGVGCTAHIVHNAIRRASDALPVDAETVVSKNLQLFPCLHGSCRNS
ncbi:UNVERIFIED_CONTAM: hypothetical protein RMT77_006370 [Armadillidium vulgare]